MPDVLVADGPVPDGPAPDGPVLEAVSEEGSVSGV